MEIKGKVHCLFEQSGTFKNEFKKLGIPAEDYDIQNNFGETDHIIDLFAEINRAYDNLTARQQDSKTARQQDSKTARQQDTIFDTIDPCQDLIVAFFPCIYFTGSVNPRYYTLENTNYQSLSTIEKFEKILERENNRDMFYKLLYKLCGICIINGIRFIFENPYSSLHYLHNNFLKEPTLIDHNRQARGDYFVKPTGYWFFNCEPTQGYSYQKPKETKTIWGDAKGGKQAGICSEERSMISPDYARNWICDFILGKPQEFSQPCFDF